MRLAVFGATGGTGPFVLREAQRRGHEITAFARRAEAIDDRSALTSVVVGDARDVDAVAKAVTGQEAVITTVSGRGQIDVARDIARAVTAAMNAADVSRLVATSSYAMVATKPYVVAGLVRRIFTGAFADQAAADHVIEGSGLSWTIARATRLVDKPPKRPARISTELFSRGPYSLTRQAWSEVLLDLVENGSYPRQIVNVTG